jgi:pyruvate formate lyase activating enzyme
MFGRIFDIIEFCLHDGPGIRTTVFFKGCPLRCQWCHNPEGQNFDKEIMVTTMSCTGCGCCHNVCVTPDHCIGCGKCVSVCPNRLRKVCGRDISVEDLIKEVEVNADVFRQSGGGVTISGGEPLSQMDFLMDLLAQLRHMHIALDTCGYAPNNDFEKAISMCDLVLFDIKHTDPDKHKKYTGVDNKLIMSNLVILCQHDVPFIIRIPLIPGVNDNDEVFRELCQRLIGAKNLLRVELLPYHRSAGAKYPMLGRTYDVTFDTSRTPYCDDKVFKEYGIRSCTLT